LAVEPVLAGPSVAGFVEQWSALALPHLPVLHLAILYQQPDWQCGFEPVVLAPPRVSKREEALLP
jgi:hypothetical protein